jgi:methionyl-tRNA formyltransferase
LHKKQKIVFFGTPADVVCVFESLRAAKFEIVAVYTRGRKRTERRGQPTLTPIGTAARAAGITIASPAEFDDEVCARLQNLQPDLFITAAYGRILPPQSLSIPRLGTLNLHPSLLPRYRGASPVVTAILDGTDTTGLTFMLVDASLDGGDIVAQTPPIKISDTIRKPELQQKLFSAGAAHLPQVLTDWFAGKLTPTPQNEAQATLTKPIEKQDGLINWNLSATHIARMVRAYADWPSAYTNWKDNLLRIVEAHVLETTQRAGLVAFQKDTIQIGCESGVLGVTKLQLGSRNIVNASDFMNGYPQLDGYSFLN